MADLCWIAVMLTVLLSAGNSSAAVDQNQLATVVDEILNRYTPSYGSPRRFPMFSLAVSIPYNKAKKMYDVSQVRDTGEQVRNTILNCDVYAGTRVVAATVLRWPNVVSQCPNAHVQWPGVLRQCPGGAVTWADIWNQCPDAVWEGMADHAEYRTLQRFNNLLNNRNRSDLLLFFVLASPCDKRCTSKTSHWSILSSINQILKWDNYVVVFSDIFQPRSGSVIPEKDLRESLERLGTHPGALGSIGLSNIFRCNRQNTMQCTSCSNDNKHVTRYCYSDNLQPGPSYNLPSTSFVEH